MKLGKQLDIIIGDFLYGDTKDDVSICIFSSLIFIIIMWQEGAIVIVI
jgi:hypothetical protein